MRGAVHGVAEVCRMRSTVVSDRRRTGPDGRRRPGSGRRRPSADCTSRCRRRPPRPDGCRSRRRYRARWSPGSTSMSAGRRAAACRSCRRLCRCCSRDSPGPPIWRRKSPSLVNFSTIPSAPAVDAQERDAADIAVRCHCRFPRCRHSRCGRHRCRARRPATGIGGKLSTDCVPRNPGSAGPPRRLEQVAIRIELYYRLRWQ